MMKLRSSPGGNADRNHAPSAIGAQSRCCARARGGSYGWRAGWAAAACALLVAQACGDSGPSSGSAGAAEQADWAALCDANCERSTRCEFSEAADACEAECMNNATDPGLMRADVLRSMAACEGQVACDESDDRCLDEAVLAYDPDAASSPLLKRCYAVHEQCSGFSDDACAYAVMFTDAGKARLEACLGSSCDQVAECIAALKQGT